MHRKSDWEARLAAYLEPLRTLPFEWGTHDCCTFAGGAVEAMTGEDPMSEFRGKYHTATGAAQALRDFGAGTLIRTLNAKFAKVRGGLAQRGDIVMHNGRLGISLGSALIAVGQEGEREGLLLIDRSEWQRSHAWRVEYEA